MIKTKYEKEYCMKCGEINPQDKEICECGSRKFIFGDNFTYTKDGGAVCGCGNNKFKKTFHLNRAPIYDTTYQCSCGNTIGVQVYVETLS
ncbi:MAG: hypothetical protein ACOCP8_00560 [archaeon]